MTAHRFISSSSRGGGRRDTNHDLYVLLLRVAARVVGYGLGHMHKTGALYKYGRGTFYGIVGVPLLFGGAFLLMHTESIPISGRSHLVFLSKSDEDTLSEEAVANILAQEGTTCLPPTHATYQAVHAITGHLLEVCRAERLVPPLSTDMTLHVIDAPIANAFVLPNGTIFVYTGILPMAKTYGGLACILGHEISHALARHAAEKIGYFDVLLVVYDFLRGFDDGSDFRATWQEAIIEFLLITVLQVVAPLAFSRKMEREADRMGMVLAAKSGYDPREASHVWERMLAVERGETSAVGHTTSSAAKSAAAKQAFVGDLLSTHPSSESRMVDLKAYAETLMEEFDAATDRLAFRQVARPSLQTLPFVPGATDDDDAEQVLRWQFMTEAIRANSNLMGGAKGDEIRAFLKAINMDDPAKFAI
ncbi:Aste57867_8988 [Aphanomyces stellatus]|uniref:Aste57867_8988 protein n=1 Tax=Aphanomyces stellatus TaxID=120398 RepID=A0A485KLN9_9STRA|nr:hypothetical protein As57867_008953 [Aphanomyces stellatus]VFT85872.1 Aste57867_8988 [Aphanomyces stellatus]